MRIIKNELRHLAFLFTGILTALSFSTTPSFAGGTLKIDDDKWINVGAGLRSSFSIGLDQAPIGNEPNHDFSLESIRLYINGQVHKNVTFTFNSEFISNNANNNGDTQVIDGIAEFKFSELFNFWIGRFLPPSDRSNLNGPYYLSTWEYPMVSAYPSIVAGRDDGLAFWGEGGKMKYQVGMFEGRDGDNLASPNRKDMPLLAGRFTYNLLDPESGYYNSSSYYGSKDILALGAVFQWQKDGVGDNTNAGDFLGANIDVLFETKVRNGGVVTVESALYNYDTDNRSDTRQLQGTGFFVSGAFLFPKRYGLGKFQPTTRFQRLGVDSTSGGNNAGRTPTQFDLGLNYIIDGHNARVSFVLSNIDPDTSAGSDFIRFLMGVQLQI